jgi:hypothetical protein
MHLADWAARLTVDHWESWPAVLQHQLGRTCLGMVEQVMIMVGERESANGIDRLRGLWPAAGFPSETSPPARRQITCHFGRLWRPPKARGPRIAPNLLDDNIDLLKACTAIPG